jgi:hypothetical protein
MTRAERLVVGVEEVVEAFVEGAIAAQVRLQQHGLEEPRGVREMPLGRAGIGHRLDALVFGRERRGAGQALGAHVAEGVAQRVGGRRLGPG